MPRRVIIAVRAICPRLSVERSKATGKANTMAVFCTAASIFQRPFSKWMLRSGCLSVQNSNTAVMVAAMDVAIAAPPTPSPKPGACRPKKRKEGKMKNRFSTMLHKLFSMSRQDGKCAEVILEERKAGAWWGTTGNYLPVRVENVPLFAKKGDLLCGIFRQDGTVLEG